MHNDAQDAMQDPMPIASRRVDRRQLLRGGILAGGTVAVASVLSACAPTKTTTQASQASQDKQVTGDRVVVLGVNGGPVITESQAKPALALVVNEEVYLVDAGLEAANQLVKSGLGFAAIKNLFITHHHLDHTSGIPGVVVHGWTAIERIGTLSLWGPPGTSKMTKQIPEMYEEGAKLFSPEEGGSFGDFPALNGHDLDVQEGTSPTRVLEDDNVTVDAIRVFHGPEVKHAYAYRFTVKSSGKSVVFSGDTDAPNANLIALSQGCDLLLHECQDNEAVKGVAAQLPPEQGEALQTHMFEAHSNVMDLPNVAKQSRAKKLVLTHYTPVVRTGAEWLELISPAVEESGYGGEVIAPMDLDQIAL